MLCRECYDPYAVLGWPPRKSLKQPSEIPQKAAPTVVSDKPVVESLEPKKPI